MGLLSFFLWITHWWLFSSINYRNPEECFQWERALFQMLASLFYVTCEQFPRQSCKLFPGCSLERGTREHDLPGVLPVLEQDELWILFVYWFHFLFQTWVELPLQLCGTGVCGNSADVLEGSESTTFKLSTCCKLVGLRWGNQTNHQLTDRREKRENAYSQTRCITSKDHNPSNCHFPISRGCYFLSQNKSWPKLYYNLSNRTQGFSIQCIKCVLKIFLFIWQ